MRQRIIGFTYLLALIAFPPYTTGSELPRIPGGVEMIVWEHQNWETNGGFERLTIWKDGRSEVVVAPLRHASGGQENLRPKRGWKKVKRKSPPRVEFVRKDIYPPDVARAKFRSALVAGIHLLESFKPGYVDGNGTRVAIQTEGRLTETVIPIFPDAERGTMNHERFLAVSEVLGEFDRNAYEVVPE
jgi:hypothetical protein